MEFETTSKIIIAGLGVIAAIFACLKAYAELKKVIKSRPKKDYTTGGTSMNSNNVSDSPIGRDYVSNATSDSHDIHAERDVYTGDVHIHNSMNGQVALPTETVDVHSDGDILLKDVYTSLYAERGEVHSERIEIKNLGGGRVEGRVYLDDRNVYVLNGTFRNRILTGEYSSEGRYTDERGIINLKLISENILSGFCSFSRIADINDQIRVSPYVWVAGNSADLVNGTYGFCTECHNDGKKCCCASPDVDMPILLHNESQLLLARSPKKQGKKTFSHNIGNTPIRQMNTKNSGGVEGHCHFFDPAENRCKIYDVRPIDCRLFPFDIKLDKNTNEYWVGYYDELCERRLPSEETMKQYAHILRPMLFLLFPYANTINNEEVCTQLNKATFNKLYKLHEFVL